MAKKRHAGEGTIGQRKSDGRWMARYYVVLPDGSKKRQQIIKKDRDEVVRLLHEELTKKEQGIPIYKDKSRTVETMCEYFIEYLDPHLFSITTLRHHQDHIRRLIVPLIGKIPLSNLKPEHVRQWMDTMYEWELAKLLSSVVAKPCRLY